jgi:hypothetical protein
MGSGQTLRDYLYPSIGILSHKEHILSIPRRKKGMAGERGWNGLSETPEGVYILES